MVGIILPLIYAIYLSFFKVESFIGIPKFVGLGNYAELIMDVRFWNATFHGIVYSLATIVLQILLGIAFALVLNESFRGKHLCAVYS